MRFTMSNDQQQQRQQQQLQMQKMQQESTDDDDEESFTTTTNTTTIVTSGYNNKNNNNNNNSNNNNIINITTNTDERRNLEFAQKLGYSDQLIHLALTRLGAEAKQNELLAELIKLSADAPKTQTQQQRNISALDNGLSLSIGTGVATTSVSGSGSQLRHIVIDGSNVALSHGNNEVFSCRGISICIDWFRQRGHKDITAFVPNWRKESGPRTIGNNNIADQELLYELERERVLVFTPSRLLDGKRVACYDDRYILKLAAETEGIVVSNDNYRDLLLESAEFRKVVQERLLMYSFVNDRFMPPDDPLGRAGPTLDVFLRLPTQKATDALQLCPYGKKCTYGVKCKFRHQPANALLQRMPLTASLSAPINYNGSIGGNSSSGSCAASNNNNKHAQTATREPLNRTKSNTIEQVCQSQLANQSYQMAASTPNNANWTQSQQLNTDEQQQQQLNTAFNCQLDLHGSDEINRHKKLQRQVPHLNGVGGGGVSSNIAPAAAAYEPHTHRLLVPTISAPPLPPSAHSINNKTNNNNHNRHQQLTRIISAPVAPTHHTHNSELQLPMPMYHAMHNACFLSASDSRINEELLHPGQTREEKRRLLRYHLSNLFPQHQVHAVLQMYPDETDAKTICAAIIHLFPHN